MMCGGEEEDDYKVTSCCGAVALKGVGRHGRGLLKTGGESSLIVLCMQNSQIFCCLNGRHMIINDRWKKRTNDKCLMGVRREGCL
jgi:hypothetical protein